MKKITNQKVTWKTLMDTAQSFLTIGQKLKSDYGVYFDSLWTGDDSDKIKLTIYLWI